MLKKDKAMIEKVAKNTSISKYLRGESYTKKQFIVDEWHAVTDTIRIFATKEDPGYEVYPMDLAWLMEYNPEDLIPVEVDIEDVKAYSKGWTRYDKPYFIEADGYYVAMNPKYLLDQLRFTRSTTIYINIDREKLREIPAGYKVISPVFSFGTDKMALTCPVNFDGYSIKRRCAA